jgi:hypothetical protein
MHEALFTAGQDILKEQLEEILGGTIDEMVADLEPLSGKSTIVIKLKSSDLQPTLIVPDCINPSISILHYLPQSHFRTNH